MAEEGGAQVSAGVEAREDEVWEDLQVIIWGFFTGILDLLAAVCGR